MNGKELIANQKMEIDPPANYPDLIREIQDAFDEIVDPSAYVINAVTAAIEGDVSSIHDKNPDSAIDIIQRYHLEETLGYLLKRPDPEAIQRGHIYRKFRDELKRRQHLKADEIIIEIIYEWLEAPDGKEQVRSLFDSMGILEEVLAGGTS